MAPDRQVFRTVTDSAGRYLLTIPNGTGDYLVHVSAAGRRTFRRRVTRTGSDSVLIVDARLSRVGAVTALAAVLVQAQRLRPQRDAGIATETGAAERVADGIAGALSPRDAGDLRAIAATVPGVSAVEGGVSVLGLGPGQNQTTLNGMVFAGGDLPRDARTRTRVATSTYDPARGGFGGAQIAVELAPGGMFTSRRARGTVDAPALQATDPATRRLGEQLTRLDASVGGDGELVEDRFYYNASAQLRRSVSDARTLLDAGDEALGLAGVSGDSAARLVSLLAASGVPVLAGGGVPERATTEASVLARLDHKPFDPETLEPSRTTWGVTGYGKYLRNEALSITPTATPGYGGERSAATAALQGLYSAYFGKRDYLTELRTALTVRSERSTPYLRLPGGRVLVSSLLPDGTGATTALAFGGNGALDADTDGWTWETTSETQLYSGAKTPHRLKLFAQSRLDGYDQAVFTNRLGTFTYNSLADVAANRPASFTRVLDAPARQGGQWSGALALGDFWRRSPQLSLVYGARLEGNAFTAAPAPNPAVEQTFGARTDRAPNTVHVSPRLGFTWTYAKGAASRDRVSTSNLATVHQGPRGVLRGGVGEFRNLLPTTLLAGAQAGTGLAGGARRLLCVGGAVPSVAWERYLADAATVPDRCADGAPAFADAAPAVQLFDPSYTAPRSWRGNLAWSSAYKRLAFTVEGLYSLNVDQPGVVDLNFDGTPRFVLADERDRPVFVSPSSIVAATGLVSPLGARRSTEFGPVLSNRSDNRSVSRQLSIVLTPDLGRGRIFVRGAYALAGSRARARGFDGATFGDPREAEWARGDFDVRHQLQLQAGRSFRWGTVTSFTRLASGMAYTPRVGGDVNGDGDGFNDRAFVADPASPGLASSDPALAAGMDALLATASSGTRACLRRHLGAVAERNSCEGPWTAAMDARISVSGQALRLGERTNVSLFLSNPLGAVDRLVHGRDLRGWGATPFPNAMLYTVRGFDAEARRFRYEVNPRFGTTRASQSTARAPFRVTLDVSLDFGRPVNEQQLERELRPGRGGRPGPRPTAEALARRYARSVPDLYTTILREADSLLLAPAQVVALRQAQAAYRVRPDSAWKELGAYLAGLGERYDAAAALKRQEETSAAVWELAWREARTLGRILSPIQLKLLPWPASMLHTATEPPKGLPTILGI